MQIGLISVIGDGFGSTRFALSELATSVAFPPYGTVIGSGSTPLNLSYTYAEYPNGTGSFNWGTQNYLVKADGAGGSFIEYTTYDEIATYNQVINDSEYQANFRIIYKGMGSWSECHRIAATGNGTGGDLYVFVSQNSTNYLAGSYNTIEMYDGVCGTYSDTTNNWYPYGTYLGSYDIDTFYADGAGGYYVQSSSPSYPPYGEFLYGDGGSSDLTWYAPDGSSGTWTYASWGCSYYADGNGGSYSNCGGYTASYGTSIYSGSYVDGDTVYFTIYFDGNSGYYTYTY